MTSASLASTPIVEFLVITSYILIGHAVIESDHNHVLNSNFIWIGTAAIVAAPSILQYFT